MSSCSSPVPPGRRARRRRQSIISMALAAVSSVKATPRLPMSSLNSAAEMRPSPSLSSMAKVVAYLSVSTIVVGPPSLGVERLDRNYDCPVANSRGPALVRRPWQGEPGTRPAGERPPPCRRAPDNGSTASSRARPTTPAPGWCGSSALDDADVLRFLTLPTGGEVEFDVLPLVEGPVAVGWHPATSAGHGWFNPRQPRGCLARTPVPTRTPLRRHR